MIMKTILLEFYVRSDVVSLCVVCIRHSVVKETAWTANARRPRKVHECSSHTR